MIEKNKKRVVLLDSHAILHRAYHALPDFSSNKGEPTGALYGLSSMLIKLIDDLSPDYIIACYDMPGPTFRHEVYEGYKAKRPKTDDDLIQQLKRSRDVFRAFGVPIYEKAGFEADDILGTIVEILKPKTKKGEIEIIIASGDMDTLQLVEGKKVRVFTLRKGIKDTILYDEEVVKERFGFEPKFIPDFKGLKGDPSDNIIGISGIGDKSATTLIQNFGFLEEMYKTLKKKPELFKEKGLTDRIINLLREGEEEAIFSKTLAQMHVDVPITFSFPEKEWMETFELNKIQVLFSDLSFRTLFDRMKKLVKSDDDEEIEEEKEYPTEEPSDDNLKKIGIALWVLNSSMTNPTKEDILAFSGKKSLKEAGEHIFSELKKQGLEKIYTDIEEPLIPIIEIMQRRGIVVDVSYLGKLSKKYHKALEVFEKNIFKEAGVSFNINSPKQLGEVLFDKLMLSTKGLKKTQGGARSTRESELEKLRNVHPIIEHILGYRELQKLLSTYVDNIPHMVENDGRLHATFLQTGTSTGRMSSADPNLQNIPARGDKGREIREAFCVPKKHVLVTFDYSQIELRVLALLSGDKDLTAILRGGKDVHSAVAAQVFEVKEEEVTKDMRRKAKVINFGIIYGMGVNSLAKSIGGTRQEAQVFYNNYFKEFPGILEYIDTVKKEAAKKGYTETLFGRRRYFEGLRSHIPYIRSAAERMAVNAPIQGTATGDIIKLAIIKADKELKKHNFKDKTHLLLQVHDELVYEIEENIAKDVIPLIKNSMETVIQSKIPLLVDVSIGENWGDLKPFK